MKASILLLAALLFSGCASQASPGQPSPLQDPYSLNCSSGTFAVYNNTSVSCEPTRICEADSDCGYLNISGPPPRYGKCVFGTCKVSCGLGPMRDCV
jgi:hypothetical protein